MARVLYFGPARDCSGIDAEEFALEGAVTQEEFWRLLTSRHPKLAAWKDNCRLAVDMAYVRSDQPIENTSEVAVIPPVSGG